MSKYGEGTSGGGEGTSGGGICRDDEANGLSGESGAVGKGHWPQTSKRKSYKGSQLIPAPVLGGLLLQRPLLDPRRAQLPARLLLSSATSASTVVALTLHKVKTKSTRTALITM
ncbi:hypothetical protein CRG98_048319 [Punica granatum]|uniref:Uncharacterized protein n=1 Tax=Punica granatum TaxID=22663 RepID=A0A2I0HIF8_PUNGR|nr:hypothetical protein CRG98_048319 [Punica granatum]